VPREFARLDRARIATAFLTDLVAHRRADLLGQAPD
jgi:hypothetical protein